SPAASRTAISIFNISIGPCHSPPSIENSATSSGKAFGSSLRITSLGFSGEEMAKILCENGAKLLRLDSPL
ncbi:hypothetical protein J7M22_10195, partial [Candidatus Poribacteria bacterium]|nr:hypothetical protein [Candidatus Poribacteria bacterium]